jgi:archaeal flagellin FlaB
MFRNTRTKEKGITGLETSIILIAFVVVASVFAYAVLSVGMYSTQESKQAIMNGLQQAAGTLEVRSEVVAYKGDANIGNTVGKMDFAVAIIQGDLSIDLTPPYVFSGGNLTSTGFQNPTVFSFSTSNSQLADCAWTMTWIGGHTGDYLLEPGEHALITVWFHDYQEGAWAPGASPHFLAGSNLDVNQSFDLEIKPPTGATVTIDRTIPGWIDNVMCLH